MNIYDTTNSGIVTLGGSVSTSGSRTTLPLNSAYTYGSAGAGVAIRLVVPSGVSTLTTVYFFADANNGTVGNVKIEVRNGSGTNNITLPGSTVLATQTVSWVGAKKWIACTFSSPPTITPGTAYFICATNADASPTANYPTILTNHNYTGNINAYFVGRTSADGFATLAGTSNFPCVCKFDTGRIIGNPFTTVGVGTSNGNQHGFVFPNPAYSFVAPLSSVVSINTAIIETYVNNAAASSPATSYTIPATETTSSLAQAPISITKGQHTRVTLRRSTGNATNPNTLLNEDASQADVNALLGGVFGGMLYTEWTGSAWVDYIDQIPRWVLYVDPVFPAGGGITAETLALRQMAGVT